MLTTINYLFLLLFPLIIISFFMLSSIIYSDIKGIVFIIGLLIALVTTNLLGNSFSIFKFLNNKLDVCNLVHIDFLSNTLPLNQITIGFSLAYFLYIAFINNFLIRNMFIIILLFVISMGDIIWNINNSCFNYLQLFFGFILGSGFGLLWALIINSFNQKYLQYFTGIENNNQCTMPVRRTFKCKTKK